MPETGGGPSEKEEQEELAESWHLDGLGPGTCCSESGGGAVGQASASDGWREDEAGTCEEDRLCEPLAGSGAEEQRADQWPEEDSKKGGLGKVAGEDDRQEAEARLVGSAPGAGDCSSARQEGLAMSQRFCKPLAIAEGLGLQDLVEALRGMAAQERDLSERRQEAEREGWSEAARAVLEQVAAQNEEHVVKTLASLDAILAEAKAAKKGRRRGKKVS